jgi:hypothetical protein
MNEINSNQFKTLATYNTPHSISIFIPTHRSGKNVNEKIDQLNLKNQVQLVSRELQAWQLDPKDIEALLIPIRELVDDNRFWNLQSDGLAVFRSPDFFEYYSLPGGFDEFVYVSDHFYVKPLVSFVNDQHKYYLLSLSLSGVKFYEGSSHQIAEIDVGDLVPEQLEDAVGYDYKEKNLQFRSGKTSTGNSIFHGHGKGKEENKLEIRKFFRAINNGLFQYVNNHKRPLVLAAVDYLVPIYREVNDYQHLYPEFIRGNHERDDPKILHEKVRNLLNGHFERDKMTKMDAFEGALAQQLASYNEDEIIAEAFNQRIDTLFVRNHDVYWSYFNKETNKVTPREDNTTYKSCLINFATVHTMLNNGNVYLLEPDEMPESSSRLNAIYRY